MKNNLIKADIQYPNLTINDFKIGDKVFLKSNPEYSLTVFQIHYEMIQPRLSVRMNNYGIPIALPPTSFMKYTHAADIIYKGHKMNLN